MFYLPIAWVNVANLIGSCLLIALVAGAILVDVRRVLAVTHRVLPGYADSAGLTINDIRMLATLRGRRRARRDARPAGAHHALHDYQRTATELALAGSRSVHGAQPASDLADHRDDLVADLRTARVRYANALPA